MCQKCVLHVEVLFCELNQMGQLFKRGLASVNQNAF